MRLLPETLRKKIAARDAHIAAYKASTQMVFARALAQGMHFESFQCVRCHQPSPIWRRDNWRRYCSPCKLDMHYVRTAALTEVQRAIRCGRLMRADQFRCVDCDKWAQCWDHRDYSKPLTVEPVCRSCNMRRGPAHFPLQVSA